MQSKQGVLLQKQIDKIQKIAGQKNIILQF